MAEPTMPSGTEVQIVECEPAWSLPDTTDVLDRRGTSKEDPRVKRQVPKVPYPELPQVTYLGRPSVQIYHVSIHIITNEAPHRLSGTHHHAGGRGNPRIPFPPIPRLPGTVPCFPEAAMHPGISSRSSCAR